MWYALATSEQQDSNGNIDDALTLTRYKEEIEQNIRSIREKQSASPWGLCQNILEPPPCSGISDSIEDIMTTVPLHI